MKLAYSYFLIAFIGTLLYSCSSPPSEDKAVKTEAAPPAPEPTSHIYRSATFEIKDSVSGKSLGWGYDLYVDNDRVIHQKIIPAIEGNHIFKTEADAQKTGQFAVEKMKKTGNFPTLYPQELDSLGVIP